MTHRYFISAPIEGSQATLSGDEAHHLVRVMRVGPGDEVRLFDGSGREFRAQVQQVGRNEVQLDVLEGHTVDRELAFRLTVGVALPKGDRQRWLVEKLVELGTTRLVPLTTRRGVAQPGAKALERLRRAVIEASKQCGRNLLMEVAEPSVWADFVAEHPEGWVAHPGGVPLPALETGTEQQATLAVGPEGGFDEDEVAQARQAGWRCVDLGPRILRIETAALFLVSAVCLRYTD